MGHPRRYKTYHALKEFCTFKNMQRRVALLIRSCDVFSLKNKSLNYAASGKTTAYKPTRKLEKVSIDLMGPLPTGRGGTHYILAILDTFTKYIRLYAIKRATTKAILNRIVNDYIPSTGKPEAILSDNGTQFTSKTSNSTAHRENGSKHQTPTHYCGICPKMQSIGHYTSPLSAGAVSQILQICPCVLHLPGDKSRGGVVTEHIRQE